MINLNDLKVELIRDEGVRLSPYRCTAGKLTMRSHIHTPDDGRGLRDVFLNGKLIGMVVYANTRAGFVRVFRKPFKLDRWGKRALTRTLRGKVAVSAKVVDDYADS